MPPIQGDELSRLRLAAREARRASDEHRRAQPPRDEDDPPDEVGDDLRRRAAAAAAAVDAAESNRRTEALAARKANAVADTANLQTRLREEAAARREQRPAES